MQANESFWPSDLQLATVVTPVSVLRTQATLLGEQTKGLLEGEVKTWTHESSVYHDLYIVVPALGGYRYRLLRVHHPMALYPVFIDEEPKPYGTIVMLPVGDFDPLGTRTLNDEEALRSWLRKTLASEESTRIIRNLYAQATQ
jgi:hypothetical protein